MTTREGITEAPIVLVTGHSLGGAVANLLAAHLNGCKTNKPFSFKPHCPTRGIENVYAYTFASPTVVAESKKIDFENIFNIMNSCGNHVHPGSFIAGLNLLFSEVMGCCDVVTWIPGLLLPDVPIWPFVTGPWVRNGQEAYVDMLQNPPLGLNLSDILLEAICNAPDIQAILAGPIISALLNAVGEEHKMGTYYDWMLNLPGDWNKTPDEITWDDVLNWPPNSNP